jgi:hypothetical protein
LDVDSGWKEPRPAETGSNGPIAHNLRKSGRPLPGSFDRSTIRKAQAAQMQVKMEKMVNLGQGELSQPVLSKFQAGANRMAGKVPKKSLRADNKAGDPRASTNRTKALKLTSKSPSSQVEKPTLLSGGNPQIAKGYGDASVQAYIEAMSGWKRDVGRRLDAIIESAVSNVAKAVKWNTPFYGIEGQGWFLGLHCFTKYVKVAFFRGTSLRPIPPGESKQKEVRYLNIHEDDQLDDAQLADWMKQASKLPGEPL